MERSRRELSKANFFVVCDPLVLEKIGSEIQSRGCVILRAIVYGVCTLARDSTRLS